MTRFALHLPVMLSLILAACAPRTAPAPSPDTSAPAPAVLSTESAQAVERTATVAYHKMALRYLETGVYDTQALIDLVPPQGVQFTLESLASDSYALRFSSEAVPGVIWRVTPEGVQAVVVEPEA